jgi:carnitine 3-dehydrogenase
VVIASSTSGILPSVFQARCRHPERVLVGHPFNPAHLIPLVEVVAGERTSPAAVDWAVAFYGLLGKHPLRVRKEAPGFVSNRMQEAVWREMFHLVNDGIATTGELDQAISDGPGLRWAIYGPAFVYFMQGGRGGMAHALAQFDPARIPDWSHNYYPEVSEELVRLLDEQTRDQAQGRSLEEWERLRDEFLVRVLEVKREVFGE